MAEKGIVSEILKQKLAEGPRSEGPGADTPEGTRGKEGPKPQEVKRTSITLPADIYRRLKAHAALEGRKMNDLMVELLSEALKKRLAGKDPLGEW